MADAVQAALGGQSVQERGRHARGQSLPAGERSQHRVQHRVRLRAWPRHGISLECS